MQLGWKTVPTIENIRRFVVRKLAMDVFVEYNVDMDIRGNVWIYAKQISLEIY